MLFLFQKKKKKEGQKINTKKPLSFSLHFLFFLFQWINRLLENQNNLLPCHGILSSHKCNLSHILHFTLLVPPALPYNSQQKKRSKLYLELLYLSSFWFFLFFFFSFLLKPALAFNAKTMPTDTPESWWQLLTQLCHLQGLDGHFLVTSLSQQMGHNQPTNLPFHQENDS